MASVSSFLHNIRPTYPLEFPAIPLIQYPDDLPTKIPKSFDLYSKVSRLCTLSIYMPPGVEETPTEFSNNLVSALRLFSNDIQTRAHLAQERSLKDAICHFLDQLKSGKMMYLYQDHAGDKVNNVPDMLYNIRSGFIRFFFEDSSIQCKNMFLPLTSSRFKTKDNRIVDWSKMENIIVHILGNSVPRKDVAAKGEMVMEHAIIRNKSFPEPVDILWTIPDFGMLLLFFSMCTYKLEGIELLGQVINRNWTQRESLSGFLAAGDSLVVPPHDIIYATVCFPDFANVGKFHFLTLILLISF